MAEPNVYAEATEDEDKRDLTLDQRALEFTVRDPQDHGGHIVYVVKGKDA